MLTTFTLIYLRDLCEDCGNWFLPACAVLFHCGELRAALRKPGRRFLGVNFPVLRTQPPTSTASLWNHLCFGVRCMASLVRGGRGRTYTHVHFVKITKSDAGLQGEKQATGWMVRVVRHGRTLSAGARPLRRTQPGPKHSWTASFAPANRAGGQGSPNCQSRYCVPGISQRVLHAHGGTRRSPTPRETSAFVRRAGSARGTPSSRCDYCGPTGGPDLAETALLHQYMRVAPLFPRVVNPRAQSSINPAFASLPYHSSICSSEKRSFLICLNFSTVSSFQGPVPPRARTHR